MPRSKNHTRRVARSRPRGIMQLNPEGYGFVRTSEGEFFVPHAKLGGAFDGDLVEVAPLPRMKALAADGMAISPPRALSR